MAKVINNSETGEFSEKNNKENDVWLVFGGGSGGGRWKYIYKLLSSTLIGPIITVIIVPFMAYWWCVNYQMPFSQVSRDLSSQAITISILAFLLGLAAVAVVLLPGIFKQIQVYNAFKTRKKEWPTSKYYVARTVRREWLKNEVYVRLVWSILSVVFMSFVVHDIKINSTDDVFSIIIVLIAPVLTFIFQLISVIKFGLKRLSKGKRISKLLHDKNLIQKIDNVDNVYYFGRKSLYSIEIEKNQLHSKNENFQNNIPCVEKQIRKNRVSFGVVKKIVGSTFFVSQILYIMPLVYSVYLIISISIADRYVSDKATLNGNFLLFMYSFIATAGPLLLYNLATKWADSTSPLRALKAVSLLYLVTLLVFPGGPHLIDSIARLGRFGGGIIAFLHTKPGVSCAEMGLFNPAKPPSSPAINCVDASDPKGSAQIGPVALSWYWHDFLEYRPIKCAYVEALLDHKDWWQEARKIIAIDARAENVAAYSILDAGPAAKEMGCRVP